MKRSVGEKIGRSIEDHFPEGLSFLGITGIAVLDVFGFEIVWLFIGFCGMSLSAIVVNVRRRRATAEILDENESLIQVIKDGSRNFYDLWDARVHSIFHDCGLSDLDRVSIYKHDADKNVFLLLGRYAVQHDYRRRNRYHYPTDKGVMGKAWFNGEHFERKLPNPDQNFESYVQVNDEKYGISRETCDALTMKSTCLWAKRLSNEKKIPFALVVVESVRRENLDSHKLADFFSGEKLTELENFLDSLAFMEPNLRLARERGF
ncbi:MAG: hypothetical protein AAFY24_19140 [Pseudomonadota bacterium]